jgi:hypothetical protein
LLPSFRQRVQRFDGDILFVNAKNEGCADEMEDSFALRISDVAAKI